MSYVGRKSGRAALIHADIPSNLNLLGDYVKIPSATTTERDALTPAVGMMLYNTTLGIMQQYNATGWASIDSPPTVSGLTYPVTGNNYLEPAGGETLIITGTNFSVGASVTIDGTAPSSITRNSSSQITITGTPAKTAQTFADGLVVTNTSGLAASINIAYDAVPTWTTAAGSLGSFVDGAFTNSSTPTIRIVAAEASDTVDYAQVSDATGDTVITTAIAGLTLGTTGANAGYLTGTLAGTNATTYNFYAKAEDDEGQFSAVRLFNIISYDYAASGGTETTYSGYKVHTFLLGQTGGTFTVNATTSCDILIVAGGGGGGAGAAGDSAGGGGAGGMLVGSGISLNAGAYTVTVGDGGAGADLEGRTTGNGLNGAVGLNSVLTNATWGTATANGGGFGGANNTHGGVGGSGGGGGGGGGADHDGGAANQGNSNGLTGYGYDGGDGINASQWPGGGGGGAGDVGGNASSGTGGTAGPSRNNAFHTNSNVAYCLGGNGNVGGHGDGVFAGENTGQGGESGGSWTDGADGGSGIVVIRYAV